MQRQHAATTCPSRVAVLVVANPNKAFLDGPFGLPLLQCPWAFSVTASKDAHVSKSCLGGTPNLARLGHQLTSRPKDHQRHPNISHSQHSPPDPSSQPATSLPKLIPPRRDKQPSLQTSRSPRGIKEPEPTSTSPPKKSLDPNEPRHVTSRLRINPPPPGLSACFPSVI